MQTADTSYYVDSATGNDANACTAGQPCLTIQRAINLVQDSVDRAGFLSTIYVQTNGGACNATFTGGIQVVGPGVGGNGGVIPGYAELVTNKQGIKIVGNTASPANCLISTTNQDAVYCEGAANLQIAGFKVQTTTTGFGLHATASCKIYVSGPMDYGNVANAYAQIDADFHGRIFIYQTSYTISGNAYWHILTEDLGFVYLGGNTVTISGSRSFVTAFAQADGVSNIRTDTTTFSGGSVSAKRYYVAGNSIIRTDSGSSTYFPGSVAGSTDGFGQYR